MADFIAIEKEAVKHAFEKANEAKKETIGALQELSDFIKNADLSDRKSITENCTNIYAKVKSCRNDLATVKDSAIYTFKSSLNAEVDRYYFAVKNNPKEEARFAKQTAKREALIAKGKTVDWKVVPKVLIDLEQQVQNIITIIDDLKVKFEEDLQNQNVDYNAKSIDLIDYFKEKASGVVNVVTRKLAREKAIKLMEEVGIPNARIRYRQYPFEFSGGMRQRIVIAIALAADPDILICDEPTTALDVTIQAQILELINKIKRERGLSVIFITHDLGVVANMADRIAVMYAGKIVEYGTAEDIFYDPRHPYTWALLSSMPDLNTNEKLESIPGTPPNMIYPPVGDAFAERNKYALEIDFEMQPPFFEISETHKAATWLLHPDAPKVATPKIITDRIEAMKNYGGAKND
ncbi:MAG: ABC transporter ATP-binding protein [Clostridia bacterium]|nr:ABC transporter ATP-binding protein [Clostridia bacterium]